MLRVRTPEAARASVRYLDAVFHEYVAAGDLRGVHQVQLLALIGRNRAEGIGKTEAAEIFTEWLVAHLRVRRHPRRTSSAGEDQPEAPTLPVH